jgi:hypothetical protein
MVMPLPPLPPPVTDSPVPTAETHPCAKVQPSAHPFSLAPHSLTLPGACLPALVLCNVPPGLLRRLDPVRPVPAAGGWHSTSCPSDESRP